MTTLKNIQIIDASKLNKVTYMGSENNEYAFAHTQQFFFELHSNTSFKFRMVFKLTHYADQNILSFSAEGQQFIGSWEVGTFSESIPSTERICTWVIDDFDAIATHLLEEIHTKFSTCEFRIQNTFNPFVKNRITALQNQLSNKKLA